MSAPRNGTPTPHRGLPVLRPFEPYQSPRPDYVGAHRLIEGKTPAQFRVAHLLKVNEKAKGVQP